MSEPSNLAFLDKEMAKFEYDDNGEICIRGILKNGSGEPVGPLVDKENHKFELDSESKICVRIILKDSNLLDSNDILIDNSFSTIANNYGNIIAKGGF
jgi:hypothetical protein